MAAVEQHAFNRAVEATLEVSRRLSDQRGTEYLDTWALEHMVTRRLDAILRIKGIATDDLAWKRLVMVASLCDVKTSRWIGEWKPDTAHDEINYLAALTAWRNEYPTQTPRPSAIPTVPLFDAFSHTCHGGQCGRHAV